MRGAPITSELRSGLAAIARGEAALDSDDRPSTQAETTSPRAPPPVSEAALTVADELLGLRDTGPHTDGAEAAGGGSTGMRLLVGGRTLEVPARGVVLGRQPGPAGIVVTDGRVSRRHARIHPTGAGIAVADLASTNGTVILRGETRINATEEGTPATYGDRIATANGVLLAEVVDESRGGQS